MGIPGVRYEAVRSVGSGQCLYVWTVGMRIGFLQDKLNIIMGKNQEKLKLYMYIEIFVSSL